MADVNCSSWRSWGGLVLDQLAKTKGLGATAVIKQMCDVGYFVRTLRAHMRFGELSRAPLGLLRFQWNGHQAECDWIARPPDPWDADLSLGVRDRRASLQALQDAMEIRRALFCLWPEIESVNVRAYRKAAGREPDLIVTGTVTQEDYGLQRSLSVVMQAKLCGLRFELDEGILKPLQASSIEPIYSR